MPDARILVIRGGAIGDFILTLPALAALRRNFPNARLEVLGYQRIAELAVAGGIVDRVRGLEERGFATFFARGTVLPREQAEYFRQFALIVSYLFDPDGIFEENVRACSAAQFIAGPHRPDEFALLHATEALLKPLERLAIFDANPEPRLGLAQAAHVSAAPLGDGAPANRPVLAAHPGSGSERKNWLESRWAEVLRWVTVETDHDVLLVGGEVEGERLDRLAAALPAGRVRVARSLPLVELGGLLAGCRAFVGHDSGITHLAGALGLPGLVIWGDTLEIVWRPRSPAMRILRSPSGLMGVSVPQVTGALRQLFATPTAAKTKFDRPLGIPL